VQKIGEEAHQEEERRIDGTNREEHPAEDQFQVCCLARVCVRDEGRSLPRVNYHEWRRSQVPYL